MKLVIHQVFFVIITNLLDGFINIGKESLQIQEGKNQLRREEKVRLGKIEMIIKI